MTVYKVQTPGRGILSATYKRNRGRRKCPPLVAAIAFGTFNRPMRMESEGNTWAFASRHWHCECAVNDAGDRARLRAWFVDYEATTPGGRCGKGARGTIRGGAPSVERFFILERDERKDKQRKDKQRKRKGVSYMTRVEGSVGL